MDSTKCVGAIVCKLDLHKMVRRGYIAMLAVDQNYRKRRIGSNLVLKAIQAMIIGDADEVRLTLISIQCILFYIFNGFQCEGCVGDRSNEQTGASIV